MKKTLLLVLVLVIVGGIYWFNKGNTSSTSDKKDDSTKSADLATTVKVSDKLSAYRNDELGFKVNYPNTWEVDDTAGKVSFVIPTDKTLKTTIGSMEGTIQFVSGKCGFPPLTTVSDRSSFKAGEKGDIPFDMIAMSNPVQGRTYFTRMFATPKDSLCYIFTFSAITLNPASKGVAVADVPTVQANNKTVVAAADQAFTDVVKSFTYVTIEGGKNEADYKPTN